MKDILILIRDALLAIIFIAVVIVYPIIDSHILTDPVVKFILILLAIFAFFGIVFEIGYQFRKRRWF
jgi:hypothetical protein